MTIAIAVANQKGGVGKTTTAVHIAHGLSLKGKKVLLADFDPQGQCATILGLNQEPDVFGLLISDLPLGQVSRPTDREMLYVLLGDKKTGVAQTVLSVQRSPITHAHSRLVGPAEEAGFDFIVIDTSPSVGELQAQALWASNIVVIPCTVDYLASEGVFSIVKTLEQLRNEFDWKGGTMGVLPTFYDEVTRESKATLADLRKNFKDHILEPIHRATALRECAVEGKTIFELSPTSRAASQYWGIVNLVLEWGKKSQSLVA